MNQAGSSGNRPGGCPVWASPPVCRGRTSSLRPFFKSLYWTCYNIASGFFWSNFLLEDTCFSIVCWLLPYINMNTHRHVCPSLLEPPPTSDPMPPLAVPTELWVELPESHSAFPPAICFTQGNVNVSMPFSRFLPLTPSPMVSPDLLFMSASPLLPDREQASVLCVALLATRHVGSWLPGQGSNLHPLHWKVKAYPLNPPGKSP